MYDGAVQRTLAGADLTEHALIASALNLADGGAGRAPATA
jgi:ribose transport system ATP-binding protein